MPRDDWGTDEIKEFDVSKIDREQVEDSLRAIQYQTLTHLARNTSLAPDVIEAALSKLEMAGIVREKEVGIITAYFLKENEPHGRLYLGGKNCLVEGEKENEIMPKPKTSLIHSVKPEDVERLAALGLNFTDAAAKLGVPTGAFQSALYKKNYVIPEILEAWKRGRETHRQTIRTRGTSSTEAVKREMPALAEYLPEVETDSRFEHTLEHITENGHSRAQIEAVKAKLIEPEIKLPFFASAEKTDGLTVEFDGDFFALSRSQRVVLLQIADLREAFEGGE